MKIYNVRMVKTEMARRPPKLCRNMQSWNVELEYFQPLSDPKNSDQRASHAIGQAGNLNEDDQTREMNDEDQATDMHEEDQTRDIEETEMDISENEIEEQNEGGDAQQALRDPHTNKMSQMMSQANILV